MVYMMQFECREAVTRDTMKQSIIFNEIIFSSKYEIVARDLLF